MAARRRLCLLHLAYNTARLASPMETEPKTSIKQMKETIKEAGLSTADLLERPHVQARYTEAVARLAEAEQLKTGDNFAKRACTSKLGKPAGRESRDWRATLFVWRGELEPIFAGHHSDYDGPPMNPSITWQGAWLSADDDTMPTEAALHASTNTFKLKISTFDEEKIREKGDATWSGQNLQREDKNDFLATDEILEEIFWEAQGEDEMETRKAFFALDRLFEMKFDGSSYKLDVGNGLEDVKDVEHRWAGACAQDAGRTGRPRPGPPTRRRGRRRHDPVWALRQPWCHRRQHDDARAALHRRRRPAGGVGLARGRARRSVRRRTARARGHPGQAPVEGGGVRSPGPCFRSTKEIRLCLIWVGEILELPRHQPLHVDNK